MNRPKNYAPKEIVGKYTIHVSGNKVYIKNKLIGKEVEIKCHPDDTFDIGEAIRIGMNRLNIDDVIRIGDTVKIVDSGSSYATMSNWDNIDKKYCIHYRYGVCPINGTIGKVVEIVDDKYIIQVNSECYLGEKEYNYLRCYNCIYVMSKCGLEKIKDGRYE